jgi:hypothetical protein
MIDIPQKKTLEEIGLDQFGQSPLSFVGSQINLKKQTMYEAGVPSNFIQDGDVIRRLNLIDGWLQSEGFVTGTTGWRIDSDGNAEFEGGYFRGDITGATGDFTGTVPSDSSKLDATGGAYNSASSGSRVRIFPDANTGIQVIDNASNDVFKALVGGTDVGDVIIGDYAGGQGIKYDKSANTTTFNGLVKSGTGTTLIDETGLNSENNFTAYQYDDTVTGWSSTSTTWDDVDISVSPEFTLDRAAVVMVAMEADFGVVEGLPGVAQLRLYDNIDGQLLFLYGTEQILRNSVAIKTLSAGTHELIFQVKVSSGYTNASGNNRYYYVILGN